MTRRNRRLGLVALVAAGLAACTGDPCVEEAAQARGDALDRFDAEDPAELSYANVLNRPARRAAFARRAHADALAACRAADAVR